MRVARGLPHSPIQAVFGLNEQLVNGIGERYACDLYEHNHSIISVGRRYFIQIQRKNISVNFTSTVGSAGLSETATTRQSFACSCKMQDTHLVESIVDAKLATYSA